MKRIGLITIWFLFFCSIAYSGITLGRVAFNPDEWYSFYFAQNMDQTSPANVGAIVLDAPAGNHGINEVDGLGFKFHDGTPWKIWGTNLTYAGNVPSHANSDWLASYMAFFGFNAVRIHHADNFYPNGLLQTTSPTTTQTMSSTGIDYFDYFMYKLKSKGIYWNFNLNVSRPWTANEVTNPSSLSQFAKGFVQWDATMVNLEKDYASKLVGRTNTYTGLVNAVDPALAFIEYTNENSVYGEWVQGYFDTYPSAKTTDSFYLAELDALWNDWLEAKYGTVEAVIAGWDLDHYAYTPTILWTNDAEGDRESDSPVIATFTYDPVAKTETIVVPSNASPSWYVQYRKNFYRQADQKYTFRLRMSASKNINLGITLQLNASPWTTYGSTTISVTTSPQDFIFTFIPTSTDNTTYTRVTLLLNVSSPITYTIYEHSLETADNFELPDFMLERPADFSFHRPPYTARGTEQMQDDITQFYIDLADTFYSSMRTYLRGTLGAVMPQVGEGGVTTSQDVAPLLENSDYFDYHFYFDHPTFPGTPWSSTVFAQDGHSQFYSSPPAFSGYMTNGLTLQGSRTKPFTVSEYNHCPPNVHAYEGALVAAAYAVQNNIAGMYQFDFGSGTTDFNGSWFSSLAEPSQLLSLMLGSYYYLAGTNQSFTVSNSVITMNADQIKIAAGAIGGQTITLGGITFHCQDDGVIAVFSPDPDVDVEDATKLVVLTFAEAKGMGARWSDSSHYSWGTTPMQLKQVRSTISLASTGSVVVHKLTNSGAQGDAVTVTTADGVSTWTNSGASVPWFVVDR